MKWKIFIGNELFAYVSMSCDVFTKNKSMITVIVNINAKVVVLIKHIINQYFKDFSNWSHGI